MRKIFLATKKSDNVLDDLFLKCNNTNIDKLTVSQEYLNEVINDLSNNQIQPIQTTVLIQLLTEKSIQLTPFSSQLELIIKTKNYDLINAHIVYSRSQFYLQQNVIEEFPIVYQNNQQQGLAFLFNLLQIAQKSQITHIIIFSKFEEIITPSYLQNQILSSQDISLQLKIIKLGYLHIIQCSGYAEALFFAVNDKIASPLMIQVLRKLSVRVKWIEKVFKSSYQNIISYYQFNIQQRFEILKFTSFVIHKFEFNKEFISDMISDIFQIKNITQGEMDIVIRLISFCISSYKLNSNQITQYVQFLLGQFIPNIVNQTQLNILQTTNFYIDIMIQDIQLIDLFLFKLQRIQIKLDRFNLLQCEYFVHLTTIVQQIKQNGCDIEQHILEQFMNLDGRNPELDELLERLKG